MNPENPMPQMPNQTPVNNMPPMQQNSMPGQTPIVLNKNAKTPKKSLLFLILGIIVLLIGGAVIYAIIVLPGVQVTTYLNSSIKNFNDTTTYINGINTKLDPNDQSSVATFQGDVRKIKSQLESGKASLPKNVNDDTKAFDTALRNYYETAISGYKILDNALNSLDVKSTESITAFGVAVKDLDSKQTDLDAFLATIKSERQKIIDKYKLKDLAAIDETKK